jgi:uncharacterized membrane-anchored protein
VHLGFSSQLLFFWHGSHPSERTTQTSAKPSIAWVAGPITARLGDIAEVKIPAGHRFTGKLGTTQCLELTQNPPDDNNLGAIIPDESHIA